MATHRIWNPAAECMPREQLRALQLERLKNVVRREYDNVPLYRRRMDEKGIKPEDIRSLDDLQYLPFMQKTDLRDEYPTGLFAVPRREIVRLQGSSGTTGKPILAGYTRDEAGRDGHPHVERQHGQTDHDDAGRGHDHFELHALLRDPYRGNHP